MLDFSIAVQIFQYSEAGFFSVIAAELEEDRGDPEHPMIFKRVPDDIRWLLDKWFQMVPVKMLRRLKVERMRFTIFEENTATVKESNYSWGRRLINSDKFIHPTILQQYPSYPDDLTGAQEFNKLEEAVQKNRWAFEDKMALEVPKQCHWFETTCSKSW